MKKWYCYVCGKTLTEEYYLISLNESTDRVFLCCDKCLSSVKTDNAYIQKIKEIK